MSEEEAPARTRRWLARDIGVIADFLSAEECDALIAFGEDLGFEDAPVSTYEGPVMMKDLRNNDRVMLDDHDRARELWERARPFVPWRYRKFWESRLHRLSNYLDDQG